VDAFLQFFPDDHPLSFFAGGGAGDRLWADRQARHPSSLLGLEEFVFSLLFSQKKKGLPSPPSWFGDRLDDLLGEGYLNPGYSP